MRYTSPDGVDDVRKEAATFLTFDPSHFLALERGSSDYGHALQQLLFAEEELRARFREVRAITRETRRKLRIRFVLPPALQALCWEALLDPASGRPLALEPDLLPSRYISRTDWGTVKPRQRSAPRALIAVAGPRELARYQLAPVHVEDELVRARRALTGVDIDALATQGRPCSLDELRQQLFAGDGYDIVYLVAHGALGDSGPTLYLDRGDGTVDPIHGSRLVELFRALDERRPALLVLASCESAGAGFADTVAALGPQIAEAGVPAVLAMQGQVTMETVASFVPSFLGELLRDGFPDRALAVARTIVRDRPDWWMPVLYNRLQLGHERLWREAVTPQQPTAEPSATAPSYATLPPLPGLVIGRDAVLEQLKTRLGVGQQGGRGRPGPITTIHGFPGQGKTTVALTLGYDEEVRRSFPGGVLWADLGERPQVDLLGELGRWGKALQTNRVQEAPDVATAAKRLAELLQEPRVLLIVDDVWEKDHGAVFATARGNCPLIITTRAAEIAEHVAVTSNDSLRLPGLTLEDGLRLLKELAPSVVQQFGPECQELVRVVDGLPLALQVAGRLLRARHARRLVDIRATIKELIDGELLEADVPHKLVKETNNRTVAALLRRSIDFLDKETRERFIILGAFAEKPATFDLSDMVAAWAVPAKEAVPTIDRLIDRGLLEPASSEEPRFQMHALLADLARALLNDLML